MSTIPQLGTLFYSGVRNGTLTWTQPGGPGTLVYPQQPFGEHVALWVGGCGHWFNHWDVHQNIFNPPSQQVGYVTSSAFLCCPLCSFIQQIIVPYTDIYSLANYILVG